ncbi:MAG: flagellar basal body P-ring formation protein FlgA [Phycisphaeraceae bacterium]|nr:flagellar basal body P-ring formation protein FlgA [Phycisphaeraceae bacterium]
MNRLVSMFGLLVAALGAPGVLRADTIELRSSARASIPVSLRDVAVLDGPEAVALGDLVVFEQTKDAKVSQVEISVDDLRAALNGAKSDIRWGRIALSGDSCSIRFITEKKEAPAVDAAPEAAPAPVVKAPAGPIWQVVADLKAESLRSAIASRLASFLKADPREVRVAFADSDNALLDTPSIGRTLDIQPTGLGAMVPVMIRVFEGERVVAAGTAKVRVEQKLHVVGATRALHRGDIVTGEFIFSENRWTTPGERLAAESSVVGSVVKNRLQPGELFLESDIEPAILVKRGDIVNLACLSGSIVMNTKARALASGRENEMIEFSPLSNSKSRVTARVVAPGQAVINAEETDDHVFQNKPVASAAPVSAHFAAAPKPIKASDQASVGAVTVQRVTTRPDGTFVVEAASKDPKKPVRKMKFLPFDEP